MTGCWVWMQKASDLLALRYGQGTCLNRQIQRPMQVSSSLVKVSNCSPAGCRWIPIHSTSTLHGMLWANQTSQWATDWQDIHHLITPPSPGPPTLPPNLEQVAPNKDVGELRHRRPNQPTEDHKIFVWLGAEEREVAHLHAALHHILPRLSTQHSGHRLGFRKPIHLKKKHKGGRNGKSQKFKMFKEKLACYGFTTPLQMQVNLTVDIRSLTAAAEGHRSHGRCCQKFSLLKISPQNESWLITIWIPTSQQPPTSSCQQLWI